MSSVYKDSKGVVHSRIHPQFNGDIVTSPRSQVYFLATEYGVVNLEGRSTWERAEALVSIAHPDFRDELIRKRKQERFGGDPAGDRRRMVKLIYVIYQMVDNRGLT